jgi:hypothetical protein
MIEPVIYTEELSKLENAIYSKTLLENPELVKLIHDNINCLYGMLCSHPNRRDDIFPVNSKERAVKLLITIYTTTIFQFSSTILFQALSGKYSEAQSLHRSLIELVAFCEYYSLNSSSSYNATINNSIPER